MLHWYLRQGWPKQLVVLAVVAVAVPILWTAIASYLFVDLMGNGLRQYYPRRDVSSYLVWWDYFLTDAQPLRIQGWLAVSGVAAAVPFIAFIARQAIDYAGGGKRRLLRAGHGGLRPIEAGVTDNYGSARILTDKECLKRYPGPSGVVIAELRTGRAGTAPLVIDPGATGAGHGMLIAGTRAGKTTSAVTMLLHWLTSAIVLDPSAEMGVMLEDALRRIGKTVHLLNPEIPGSGFNALAWINITKPLAAMDVKEVISWVFPDDKNKTVQKDGYFEPTGKSLCTAILADLLWSDRPAEEKTLRTFRKLVVTTESQMKGLLADIHAESKSPMARDLAGTLMKITPKQFSGVYGQATQGTEWLSEPELADLVSGNKFRTSDIIDGNTIVFCQIPLHSLEQSPGAGRVIIGALMQAVYNAKGKTRGRVLVLLDEAWCLGSMQVQKSAIVAGAKSGLTLVFLYQAVGQVREVWGEPGAITLYNNLEWRAVAACRDSVTAEEVSKAFGHIGVVSYSEGVNAGSQRPAFALWGSRSSGDTSNKTEINRRLVLPQEILEAPRDEMFVIANGNMRLRMPVYYRRPELQGVVKPSPYYTAAE
jgi:type IV secretion system protein VirD4